MKNLKSVVAVLMVAATVIGTAATRKTTTKKNNNNSKSPSIGMTNPASSYCVEQGGESIIVKSQNGEYGVCKLKDGTAMEEWEYYRSSNNNSAVKPEKPIGMTNPASVFCEKHGGKSINVKDKDGNEIGKCQFKDGTKVDEWDYYRENN